MGRKKIELSEYRERLSNKYGPQFIEDFDAIFSGDIQLFNISKNYKISRMYASMIFERLYGATFTKAKNRGWAKDSDGKTYKFNDPNDKYILLKLEPETHSQLKAYSEKLGLPMTTIARDCIVQLFNKDGLDKLARLFT